MARVTQVDRRNPEARHGWVSWPIDDPDWRSTGEGGMGVYAVWIEEPPKVCIDDMVACLVGSLVSPWAVQVEDKDRRRLMQEAFEAAQRDQRAGVVHHEIVEEGSWLPDHMGSSLSPYPDLKLPLEVAAGKILRENLVHGAAPLHVTGCLYLGSSGGSWWSDEKDRYWEPTLEDLAPEARAVLAQLSSVYDSEPRLLTFIDT